MHRPPFGFLIPQHGPLGLGQTWVGSLEGCQDLEICPQFLVQRPGKSVGPWDPSKISGSGTSTDENWPSCPILPFWQSKHFPRGAVSGFNSLPSWGCLILGRRGTAGLTCSCCETEAPLGQETRSGPINSGCPDSLFKMDEKMFSPPLSVLQMWSPVYGGGVKWGSAQLRDVPEWPLGCPCPSLTEGLGAAPDGRCSVQRAGWKGDAWEMSQLEASKSLLTGPALMAPP